MLKKYFLSLFLPTTLCGCLFGQEIVEMTFLQNRLLAEVQTDYSLLARNGVSLYRVLYTTHDLDNQRDTASGLLIIPDVQDAKLPTVVYQHGTVSAKDDVPSLLAGGYQLAEALGAFGYITLAPDFLGLGSSRGLHPYVHAESEAWAAIDMMKAVQTQLPQLGVEANEQLFITGYSQGGHAAMALHWALEQNYADEFPVTAAAPMSGPYSISGEMKNLFLSDEEYGHPAYLAFTILSYNAAYGLFEDLEEYFVPSFAKLIKDNLADNLSLQTLNTLLKTGLRQKHDGSFPKFLLQDSVRQAVLSDPNHPLNVAMAKNDVYNWAPQAPTRLFYCTADDQVPYTNSLVAKAAMLELEAVDVDAVDVSPESNHGQCVFPATIAMSGFFSSFLNVTSARDVLASSVQIFPNPARQNLYLQGIPQGAFIELLDLRGQLKKRWIAQSENMELGLSDAWSGIHLLRIRSDKGDLTQKVLLLTD